MINMHDKEKLIIENRLAEAIKKDYKGLDGKFGIILKNLGQSIFSEDAGYYSSNEWKDVYEMPEEEGLPIYDVHTNLREVGKMFDALKFGTHLEITYLDEARVEKIERRTPYFIEYEVMDHVLTVSYKSYPVYREVENTLYLFIPGEWEKDIERIYNFALKIKKQKKEEMIIEYKEKDKKDKINLLDRLKRLWGI
jgi:hypothetical protein